MNWRWKVEAASRRVGGGSGGALGCKYVKNYLYSCFMICSGGVCFKVLPWDWQCVTKMQTYGVLKRRNWLICECVCERMRVDVCICLVDKSLQLMKKTDKALTLWNIKIHLF